MAFLQYGVRDRGGCQDRILEQRRIIFNQVDLFTRVEDQAYVRDGLLFELVGIKFMLVTAGKTPVDPAREVADLVFAHAVEIHPRTAAASQNFIPTSSN